MKKWKKILSVMLAVAVLLLPVMDVPVEAADSTKQIDVLFTHDTHSHLDSFSTIVNGKQEKVCRCHSSCCASPCAAS